MAKKSTIIETVSVPKKKTAVKKTVSRETKVATETRLRANKTAVKKKTTGKVLLNDEKIKELLETITKLTIDLESANETVKRLIMQKITCESKTNDLQNEFNALNKTYTMSEMTRNVLADSADKTVEELNTTRSLLIDCNAQLNYTNELLTSKQRELENTNINYVKLNNMFTTASQENQQLRKELKELQDKWYNKLFKR